MSVMRLVLQKIWHGVPLNGDDIIALILMLVMLVSLSHLVTMLITRWGDRHIAVKSLLASVLVHTVCLLGLEVFNPLDPKAAAAEVEEYRPPEHVTQILVESDDTVALSQSGNTPIPDRATQPEVELNRMPHDARQMETPDVPERQPEQLDSLDPDAEDISQFEKSADPQMTVPVDTGAEGPRVVAANDPAADVDTTLKQNTADVYTPNTERVLPERGFPQEAGETPDREMSTGSVTEISTDVVAKDTSITTATGDLPDGVALPRADATTDIDRKSAPLTGADPLEVAGINIEGPRKRTLPSRSFDARITRPSRTMRNPDAGQRPVRQNTLTPQTPIPLVSDYDAVRTGMAALDLTEALRSAARLVDSNVNSMRRRDTQPAAYRLRNVEQRRDAAARFGGTTESEAAVELSLRWFSGIQSRDGHWDAETWGAGQVQLDENGVDRRFAGRDADTGITALVTLSFLGAGYTHESGKYAVSVDRALHWLISQQDENGSLAGNATHYARMYCHAMATYALAEALGMQNNMVMEPIVDPGALSASHDTALSVTAALLSQQGLAPVALIASTSAGVSAQADTLADSLRTVDDLSLRAALLKAITYTISQQDPDSGGWRYKFGQEGDISMFGWQMMSLKSAAIAGVTIHPEVRQKMIDFLNSVRQGEDGGLFGYRRSVLRDGQPTEPISPVMTAEALFCQQMLGYPRETAATREAVQYIMRHLPRLSQLNLYYWYYGTLAMYQYGGRPWEEWNARVRDTLISEQRRDGANAGSWDPNGPWGRYGGRLYSTAIATLTLEVYYRLLPLYRMNENTRSSAVSQ